MTKFAGGATVPLPIVGVMAATWPLVDLVITETSVTIQFRAPWIRSLARLVSFGGAVGPTTAKDLDWWTARIADITLVRAGQRSVLIQSKHGDCSFGSPRFLPSSRAKIANLRTELELLNVNIQTVDSNYFARIGMKRGSG
jgi:hypothetical protein